MNKSHTYSVTRTFTAAFSFRHLAAMLLMRAAIIGTAQADELPVPPAFAEAKNAMQRVAESRELGAGEKAIFRARFVQIEAEFNRSWNALEAEFSRDKAKLAKVEDDRVTNFAAMERVEADRTRLNLRDADAVTRFNERVQEVNTLADRLDDARKKLIANWERKEAAFQGGMNKGAMAAFVRTVEGRFKYGKAWNNLNEIERTGRWPNQ